MEHSTLIIVRLLFELTFWKLCAYLRLLQLEALVNYFPLVKKSQCSGEVTTC